VWVSGFATHPYPPFASVGLTVYENDEALLVGKNPQTSVLFGLNGGYNLRRIASKQFRSCIDDP